MSNSEEKDGTFLVVSGYDRRKNPEKIRVRPITLSELKSLGYGDTVEFLESMSPGVIRTAKVNGAVKRWKREPDRLEVPLKYGLRECARFSEREALSRLVVRVTEEEREQQEKLAEESTGGNLFWDEAQNLRRAILEETCERT